MPASPTSLTDLLHAVRARYRLVHVDETQSVLLLYVERLLRATGCDVLRLRHLQSMAELVITLRLHQGRQQLVLVMEFTGRGSAVLLRTIGTDLGADALWQLGWDARPDAAADPDEAGDNEDPPWAPRIRRCTLREAVYHEGREPLERALRALVADWDCTCATRAYVELSIRGAEPPEPFNDQRDPRDPQDPLDLRDKARTGQLPAGQVLRRWLGARAAPRIRQQGPSRGAAPRSEAGGDRPVFLLVGAPGSGKSTLLRHFAVTLAREHLGELDARTGMGDGTEVLPVPATRAPIVCNAPPSAQGADLERLLEQVVQGMSGKLVRLFAELGLCVLLIDGPMGPDTITRMQRQPTLVAGSPPKVLLCTRARYFVQGREVPAVRPPPPAPVPEMIPKSASGPTAKSPTRPPGVKLSGHLPLSGPQQAQLPGQIIEEAVHSGWDLGYLDPLDDERLHQYLILRLPDPVSRSAALGQLARSDNLRRLCRRPGLVAALTDISSGPPLLGTGFAQGAPSPPLLDLHRELRPAWLEGVAGDRRIERTAREAVARVLARRLLRTHGAAVPWWDLVPDVGADVPGEPDGARLLLHLLRSLDDTMFIVDYEQDDQPPLVRFALPSAADYFIGEDIAARLTVLDVSRVQVCPQRGHRGPVRAVALSPSGRFCATGGEDATLRVWETGSGFLLRTIAAHRDPVTAACFVSASVQRDQERSRAPSIASAPSLDEHTVASASLDYLVRLWDLRSGACLRTLVGHTGPVTCLAVGASARLLASGALDGTVRVWDLSGGAAGARCVRVLALPAPASEVTGVSLSQDGRVLGVTSPEGLHVYQVGSGARLFSARFSDGGDGAVRAVALSPDGRLCACGGEGPSLRLLRVPGGRRVTDLPAPDHHVTALGFSADGRTLAATGAEGHLYLYDVSGDPAMARLVLRRKEHLGEVLALSFAGRSGAAPGAAPGAPQLVTGGGDSLALLWDPDAGKLVRSLDGCAAGTIDERAVQVRCLEVSPDGEWLAVGNADGRVRLWDLRHGRLARELKVHEGAVLAVQFSPDGAVLASGSEDQSVCLWDAQSGDLIDRLEGHFSDVTTLAFSPGGLLLATGSDDETVRVREVIGGLTTCTLSQPAPLTQVLFSPDGRYIHSTGLDGRIRTWETSGAALRTLGRHLGAVRAMAVSADGRLLASGGDDQVVRVWDAQAGRAMHALCGHGDAVTGVAFSPDGALLATCGLDRSVRLWEPRGGLPLLSLEASAPLRALGFSPDGQRLLVGGDDGVWVWQMPEGRLLGTMLALGAGWLTLVPVGPGVPPAADVPEPPGPRLAVYLADPETPPGLRMSDGLTSYPLVGWTRLCLRGGLVGQALLGRPYPVLEDIQVELQAAPVPMPVLESSGSKAHASVSALHAVFLDESSAPPVGQLRLVTADELLSSESLVRGELARGEVVPVSPTTYGAGRVSGRLQAYLALHVLRGGLGDLPSADTGYLLARNPDVVRAPDVSYVSRERIPQGGSEGYFTGAPDLAAEVISPSNGWEVVQQKAQEYLATGARLVLVLDPQTRTVHVHDSPVRVRILSERDVLSGGSVLPGWSVAVKDLFG